MTDNTDVVVTTETLPALKSIDTSSKAEAKVEPKVEPKTETVKVEPKEPEATATPPEGDDAPDADSPQAKKQRLPRWMKERLERERQVTEARTREAMLREFQQQQTTKVEPPKSDAKTLEDFDFDQGAYTDYLVERKIQEKETERSKQAEQKKQAEAAESLKSRIDAFEEKAGDGAWEDIVDSPINKDAAFKPLVDMFWGEDGDIEIAHYLATHLDEAKQIAGLSRLKQVQALAKIVEGFDGSQKAPEPEAPKAKKTTTAPPPVKTVSGAGKPSVDIYDPNLTTEQRIALWKKQKKG